MQNAILITSAPVKGSECAENNHMRINTFLCNLL